MIVDIVLLYGMQIALRVLTLERLRVTGIWFLPTISALNQTYGQRE